MSREAIATIVERSERLQALCADVYVAGVEIGLPRDLLERLWQEIGRGDRPEAFRYDGFGPTEPRAAEPPRPEPPPPALPPVTQRQTVLVVDDDPMMLSLLVKILGSENYELIVANAADEAVAKAQELAHLDLLITDCVMPGLTGRQVATKIRERFPAVPVLFQTGFCDTLFETDVELGQGEAFLEKPFTKRGLQEAARLLLFGSTTATAAPPPAASRRGH